MSISVLKPDRFLLVEYDPASAIEWLQREIEDRLYKTLTEQGPIPYSDAGVELLTSAVTNLLDEIAHPEKAFRLVLK